MFYPSIPGQHQKSLESALQALGIDKEDSARYASSFASHGYNTFSQVADNSSDDDLFELGVDKKFHRQLILKASSKRPPVAAAAVPVQVPQPQPQFSQPQPQFSQPQPQFSQPIVITNSNPGMYRDDIVVAKTTAREVRRELQREEAKEDCCDCLWSLICCPLTCRCQICLES